MNIERFSPAFSFELKDASDKGIVSGYASTFGGEPDSHGDTIARGAFTKSLDTHRTRGTAPAMFWSHDQSEPVGRWLELKEDDNGLAVTGKLTLGTKRGAEAYELAKDDALGLSIGFRLPPGGAKYDGDSRELREVDLAEVSLVALPSNHRARITAVKHQELDTSSPVAFERALRERMGLSRRAAKRFMLNGYDGVLESDEDEDAMNAARKLQELTNFLRKYK